MRPTIITFFIALLTLIQGSGKKVNDVDSILDRLERKLLESRQDSLLLSDSWNKPINPENTEKMEYKEQIIQSALPNQEKLMEVGSAIEKIDLEVNRLADDMERLKQAISIDQDTNSQIEIKVHLKDTSNTIIRELSVELDGYPLYRSSPDLGLWAPRASIPIYLGPLKQGEHKLKVVGRVARTISEKLPIDDNTFHLINHEFKISVPSGKYKKGYQISLNKVQDKKFNMKADIIEYSL